MAQTTPDTVAAWLLDQCTEGAANADPDLPTFRGMNDGSEAEFGFIRPHASKKDRFLVRLSDGTKFNIIVEPTL